VDIYGPTEAAMRVRAVLVVVSDRLQAVNAAARNMVEFTKDCPK
jgi:hypothetical protein